jgi:polyphenol oxidase
MNTIDRITAPHLDSIPHGFLGRRGGVSTGIYHSLNVGLGSDDMADLVHENRKLVTEVVLPGASLMTVHQIHSADVVTVTQATDQRPQADALVTNQSGLLLGILTADCGPVLFADVKAGVVGAAHAGWKGAIAGVTDNTIAAMEQLGAKRDQIVAAIGPCIARASYEVDENFLRRFEEADPENERFFSPGRDGHHQFDLEGYIASRLAAAGITRIAALGLDTYGDEDRFFSYRRSTHRKEPDYGRQISLIGLPE